MEYWQSNRYNYKIQLTSSQESYIGDVNSKTFTGLLKSEPYENFVIQKKECMGHVQKRMGTRIRNLKKNVRGLDGKVFKKNRFLNRI